MNVYEVRAATGAQEPVASEGQALESAQELIEDYLDHLCAPLIGIVPYAERERLRQEAAFNIEGRAQQFSLDGYDDLQAAALAIGKYGPSDELSASFLQEWLRYRNRGALARRFGLPTVYAAFIFGQATFWCLFLAQLAIFYPDPQPYTFGLKLWEIREILPEPLPLPDRNPVMAGFWLIALLTPLVAGWLTGAKTLTGAVAAVARVVVACAIVSLTVGLSILPRLEGVWLAFAQIIWWVPCGTLVAHFASTHARCRHVRFRLPKNLKNLRRKLK